ncbi:MULTISPECIES: hybrid sensor histidine kinase/response regulator [unclassified Variovorax]|uniref:ATP-binding response regulator n=1 Tax=unclassified Variovorax TaxID=663243 RepID=UPI00076DCB8F|nr:MULTISPECIES: hybrid sensor histidine kinase/response regulator [unclassified Variovorax]KWT97537.1 periplasmic sensor hybrid histidine kinase [Variovorax sp. WDL1]PNG51631.1 Sensory/regulatory protein RpfC [Variovorax sp. B2]PNG54343.1 Sensory/regulatory protein RpfC [Variovorax sp. B4]VTV11838.1 Sensory/regulatory protein RpfC [Variovorax sp. WDL1]
MVDKPRLPEERMLVEQLRLQLGNIGASVIPTILLALLLVWVLSNETNALAMRAWAGTIILLKLYLARDARRLLASEISPASARRLLARKMVLNAIDGVAWGSLAWAALGTTTLAGNVLVVAVLAGVAGSSMSSLAPILPAFIVFGTAELIVLGAKLWSMDDPAYDALGVAAIIYTAALLGQARNGSRAARRAIGLRFENLELIERLRIETEHAQAAHRAAEEANLAKSRFLAAASHDLRQPIHAQGLFLEVLSRTKLSADQYDVLANARATWQASAEMLDTLLDFSRIEAGVVEPQAQVFPLQPMLNKIENELAPQADAKGIVYRSRETHAAVRSDPALVALILRNLVSNAIRYTEQGGVLVACRARGEQVLLEVWDTGIGIEPAQHQAIFREFHQLGNAERDRRKGLGLGLAIAQGLARALGQELSLVSVPGRGSVFRLTLPAARAGVVADEGAEALPAPARVFDLRVLVIDDDESVRTGMRQLLGAWGCACDVADSIEEAQALARAHRPGLVISDYRLRELRTGAEAIAALRSEFGASLPALLITGDTAPQRLREARASGVPLLHKPVLPRQLYRAMTAVLNGRELDSSFAALEARRA